MRNTKGFTLLEILVAITIYAILVTIAATVLSNILTNSSGLLAQTSHFNQLQRSIALLQRDFIQVSNRSIINEQNQQEAALVSPRRSNDFTLTLSVYQSNQPFFQPHQSNIRRIGYQVKDQKLIRIVWPVLDRLNNNHSEQTLLDNIAELHWQYLGVDKLIYNTWPPYNQLSEELPIAIKMQLKLIDGSTMDKLFLMKG